MWGLPDTLGRFILISGKRFFVRGNLWLALIHLRHHSDKRLIWIDAVCVNQNDPVERGYQIQQMRRVYEQAQSVQVWIGLEADNCGKSIDLLRKLAHMGELLLNLDAIYINDEFRQQIQLETLKDLFKFFDRDYWHRVWIIQEVAMATQITICCGRYVVPWDAVDLACIFINELVRIGLWPGRPDDREHGFETLQQIEKSVPAQLDKQRNLKYANRRRPREESQILSESEQRSMIQLPGVFHLLPRLDPEAEIPELSQLVTPLDSYKKIRGLVLAPLDDMGYFRPDSDLFDADVLLGISQRASCTDPRDKIYGLLGIIDAGKMPTDYTKNMFQVYEDSIKYITNPELRIPTRPHSNLPSQYDFRTVSFSENIQRLLNGPFRNPGKLVSCARARGYYFNRITKIGPPIDESSALKSLNMLFNYGFVERLLQGDKLKRFAHQLEDKWKDMSSIIERVKPISCHVWAARLQSNYDYVESAKWLEIVNWPVIKNPLHVGTTTIFSGSPFKCPAPRLYLGSEGQIGLVPDGAENGDIVCEFFESSAATVLRWNGRWSAYSDTSYYMIGRAVILGEENKNAFQVRQGFEAGFGTNKVCSSGLDSLGLSSLNEFMDIIMDLETMQLLTF